MRYGIIFIPDGSFGLIVDKQEVSESLQRLYEHLLPGGKLVLDIEMPRARSNPDGERKWGGKWVTRPDGAKIVVSNLGMEYDPDEQVQATISRYELFKKGRLIATELEDFVLRYYERDEFQRLLETAGFTGIRVARPHDCVSPGEEGSNIMFECRRYS